MIFFLILYLIKLSYNLPKKKVTLVAQKVVGEQCQL